MKGATTGRTNEQTKIGEKIISVLGLEVNEHGKVKTSVGNKNALNLYLTIQQIIQGEIS